MWPTVLSATLLTLAKPASLLGVAPSATASSAMLRTAIYASKKTSVSLVPLACLHQQTALSAWFQKALASPASPSAPPAKQARPARLVTRITVYQLIKQLALALLAPSITARNVIPTIFASNVFLASSFPQIRSLATSSSTKCPLT